MIGGGKQGKTLSRDGESVYTLRKQSSSWVLCMVNGSYLFESEGCYTIYIAFP